MDKVFSVDDLAGFWKLSAGMQGFPRTDSEQAFQDFLKRIPSASNLASQSLDQAQQLQLQQQVQQFQQAQQAGLGTANSFPSSSLGEVGSLNVGGIPRVPSLDLLRQLVNANQSVSPQGAKAGSSGPDAIPRASDVPISPPLPDTTGGVSTLPLVPSLPLTSNCLPPAPMQPYQHMKSSAAHSNGGTDSGPASGGECHGKAEIRRARRMLSNRESARRSRRRKQEHLSQLEDEINRINEEKRAIMDQLEDAERQLKKRDDEVARLRRENDMLRDEAGMKHENGRKVARSGSLQRVASAEHPAKKGCHGRTTKPEQAIKPEVSAI
ncbi:g999 [Coccomyxa viridis]|uniref:G999 protein n=1 Tax=Coccomyxa viridis TaxID=1274662 RepID=A0ABP1FM93_9CHLO